MFTEQAREAIVRAQDEAREMRHESVKVEHLLLGLSSDQAGIPGCVFADFGLTIQPVRDLVRQRLGVGSGTHSGGTVLFSIRFETKRRAWPFVGPGPRPTVRLVGSALVESLGELDLGD